MLTMTEIQQVRDEAEMLYSRSEVEHAVEIMAQQITSVMADTNPIVLAVLTGAIIPAGLLTALLDFPLECDYLHATRYRGATTGSRDMHWLAEPRLEMQQRTVLIVDDILDEGDTLRGIIGYCLQQGASQVYTAVLARKDKEVNRDVQVDFVGLELPDRYVFGYGLDYKGYWRNAPGIFAVKGM